MYTNRVLNRQRGVSLIELIMYIVIVSTAIIGILSVMNVISKNSADPVIHKQALAIADSLLEEIELQDFAAASGTTSAGAVNSGNRTSGYHVVNEYNGFAMNPFTSLNGSTLSGYSTSVSVQNVVLGSIASASAVLIAVTVTDPSGNTLEMDGYRTAF